MAFGLSFGMNKTKGSSSTNVNKTETTNQTQTGTTATSGTTSTTGNSATQTSQNTSGGTTGQQSTTGQQTSQQQATQFSQPVLSSLESTVQSLLGAIPNAPQQMAGSFDHNAFVSQGTQAASSRINTDLEASLNSIFDTVGGRDDQNSMATLLANRTRGDSAAQLAGINASLEAQAQDIDKNRFLANLQGVGQQEGYLSQVVNALKGGQSNVSGATQTAENTNSATQNQQATTGSSNTQMNQTEVMNQLQTILQSLQGTTNTVGTEDTKSKQSSIGGGAGISI